MSIEEQFGALRGLADALKVVGREKEAQDLHDVLNVIVEKIMAQQALVPEPETPERIHTTPFPNRPAPQPSATNAHEERMLKWFTYDHLPANLQTVSAPWCELAVLVSHQLKSGPERTVALRKLLEGKDAAVRAALQPGA